MPLDAQGNISANKRIRTKAFLVVLLVSALFYCISPVSCGVDLTIEDQSTVGEGTNVRMRCNGSDGMTDKTNTWFVKDTRNITISDKYSIRNDHQAINMVILTIRAVTLADSGTYQCKTSAGDSSTVLLTVYGDPQLVVPDEVIAYDGRKAFVAVQITFLGIGLHLSVAKGESIVSTETAIIDKVLKMKYIFTILDVTPKSTGFYTVQWSHSSKNGDKQFHLQVKGRLNPPYQITVSSKGEVKFDYIQQRTALFDSLAIFLIRFWPKADPMDITNVTVSSDQRSATVHFPEECSLFQLQMWSVGNHTTSIGSEIVNVKAAPDLDESRFWQAHGTVFVKDNDHQLGELVIPDYIRRSDVNSVCLWMSNLPSRQIIKAAHKCYALLPNLQASNLLKNLFGECISLNQVSCSEVTLRFSEVCQGFTTPPSSDDPGAHNLLIEVLIPIVVIFLAIAVFIFLWKRKPCCRKISHQPTGFDLKDPTMGDPKWNKRLTPILNKAVTYLSGELASLLDFLLSKRLLDSKKYKKMIQTLKDETKDEEVARDLLLELVERPAPSFDEFVNVLEEYVEKNPGSLCCNLLKLLKDVDVTKTKASSESYCKGLGATSNLERRPENGELHELSRKLFRKWKQVARQLKVPEEENDKFSVNHRDDVGEQVAQMLRWWRNKNGPSATVACLCRALLREDLTETASEVFSLSDTELASLQK